MQREMEIVTSFLRECGKGKSQLQQAFRQYFTSGTEWENVGFVTTNGVQEAIDHVERLESEMGFVAFRVEIRAIAAHGSKVLTERVDFLIDSNGEELDQSVPVMGIFHVEDDHITLWRDYFDTARFSSLAK